MKKKFSLLTALILVFLCAFALPGLGEEEQPSLLRDLLLNFDYGAEETIVIGHKSPDSDTVGAAMGYAWVLSEIGVPARAAVTAPVNRETAFALESFGLEAPEVLENAAGKQLVLVDHSDATQTVDGADKARIAGILDHHGFGTVVVSERIPVISMPIGSTCSLVYLVARDCGLEIPRDVARELLMGLLSDTKNMTQSVTEADKAAWTALMAAAELKDPDALYAGMREAALDYSGMTDWEIFLSDYKEYRMGDTNVGIGCVKAVGEAAVREMTDRMKAVMAEGLAASGMDMLFVMVANAGDNPEEHGEYLAAVGDGAEMMLEKLFGNGDGEGRFLFDNSLSRKKDFVPVLKEALE